MKTQAKGPFLGINNRLPDFGLHVPKTGDFLRDAINVDVTNRNSIKRRQATSLVQALTGAHSLHMVSATDGFLVIAGVMYQVTLPAYSQTLFKVLTNDDPVTYLELNGSTYFSNGTDSGRIESGGWFPWGLPTPDAPTPTLIAGSLLTGTYRVSLAHCNSVTGEEGGVSAMGSLAISGATGGLRVPLPAAEAGGTHINVYVSTANGSIPFLKSSVAAGTSYLDVTTLATGREANLRYEAPLPAGTQLFEHNGCLCSVKGKVVYEGLPFRPGYYLPIEGWVPFKADVSNAVPAQNGIYIVADKTFWFPGPALTKVEGAAIQDVLPYGGVPGTAFAVPGDKKQVGWFGTEGIVLANTLGEVEAAMADNVSLTPPTSGVSVLFSDGGYKRVVSGGWCLNLENKAATRYEDFAFTACSRGYGVDSSGIHQLTATGKVSASIDLGKEDFGREEEKTVPAIYLGVSSETPMAVTIATAQQGGYEYLARSCSETMDIHRVNPGLGLRGNWFDISLANTEGSDFNLASVSFAPHASAGRI